MTFESPSIGLILFLSPIQNTLNDTKKFYYSNIIFIYRFKFTLISPYISSNNEKKTDICINLLFS